jgi:carbohydrate kinase (thermoresistant glucokinase family)
MPPLLPKDFLSVPRVVVIAGVAGSGKSTVGRALAERLQWIFYDADDLHTAENRDRMHRGLPLDDERREPWLRRVRAVIEWTLSEGAGAVIACSALTARYRATLSDGLNGVQFVFLEADREVLLERLSERADHFAGVSILDSQLEAAEPPADGLRIDTTQPVDVLVDAIVSGLRETTDTPRARPHP